MAMLNRTVVVQGREYKVPITYAFEGGYYVFSAPSYKLTVSRQVRTAAWKEFDGRLKDAVLLAIQTRL
jgi:hypothetical protein